MVLKCNCSAKKINVVWLFNGNYGLFNAKIWSFCKCFIVIERNKKKQGNRTEEERENKKGGGRKV